MNPHLIIKKIEKRIEDLTKLQILLKTPFELTAEQPSGLDETPIESLDAGKSYRACEQSVIFHADLTIPAEWQGGKVYVGLEFGGAESLVYIDGKPTQAIDNQHHDLLLADPAVAGRGYKFKVDAYTGSVDSQTQANWTGAGDARTTDKFVEVMLRTCELQLIDRETEALVYDLKIPLESAKVMDADSRQYFTIVSALDDATNILDFTKGKESPEFHSSVAAAREYLKKNLYDKYDKPVFSPRLFATGHAHIDTAWLWRLAQSRKKIERTFTTATELMEIYPEYRFSASQPQQYAYLKEDNPAVYARVKAAVAAGTWEPLGGMWVESDCNVVSGESLVRQFLYGQRFFEKEFGKRTDVVWLPDVFGYSAAFPQIIKKAGMKYFMTIKIYWNQFNTPPYQTFDWEGIDGTTVLTHFSPIGGYNSAMTAEEWRKDWTEYKQKHITDSVLYVYGFGDGGGGPTRHMVEAAKRAKSLPGTPEIILSTNNQFFKDLEKQVDGNPALPRWVGELYLEYHRGTYTSQAKNKLANRQSEILLQTAEQTSSLALLNGVGSYPQDELDVAWKLTLLNQFHDIIPGSSIHAVYEDSTLDYVKILATGHKSVKTALASVIERLPAKTGDVLIYNPLSWDRSDVAELPTDVNLPGQKVTTLAGEEKTLVKLDSLPSLGYELVNGSQFTPLTAQDDALKASTTALENKFFTITLDKNAEIESIFDKIANREVIDNSSYCKGNSLLSFEDRPLAFDAWDIDIYYADKMTPIRELDSIKVIEEGPLRASVEIRRHFGADSSVTQRISIYRDIARIDFDTMVDWEERQTLLKAAFPVTIQSARATYDIQFGNVERPTHWNTSWDYARFEVCGHKWADLSEGDYGVSLLSNCKYGWDTKGNVMRLTLLKGAVSPDADADRGRQFFAYSLFPHQGDWRAAETVQRAYEFNVPVKVHKAAGATAASGNLLPTSGSLFSLDAKNLIIETVKKAEDDDQSLIVRLYEAYGQRGRAALTVDRKFKKVMEVNLMEEKTDETRSVDLSIESGVIALNYTPYEIKTLKITF